MSVPLVPVTMAEGAREYLYRLVDLGVIEGPLGEMQPPPEILKIVEALHHVLAGGKVEIEVSDPGNRPVVQELSDRLSATLR
jgi:hypothetical protein